MKTLFYIDFKLEQKDTLTESFGIEEGKVQPHVTEFFQHLREEVVIKEEEKKLSVSYAINYFIQKLNEEVIDIKEFLCIIAVIKPTLEEVAPLFALEKMRHIIEEAEKRKNSNSTEEQYTGVTRI